MVVPAPVLQPSTAVHTLPQLAAILDGMKIFEEFSTHCSAHLDLQPIQMMESTKHGDDEMLKIVEQESIPDEKMMFQQVEVNAVAIKAARR